MEAVPFGDHVVVVGDAVVVAFAAGTVVVVSFGRDAVDVSFDDDSVALDVVVPVVVFLEGVAVSGRRSSGLRSSGTKPTW
jgi:hypothetical protein